MTGKDRIAPQPVRVVHVLRPDHSEHHGGDVMQLRETVEALRSEGIDAVAATLTEAPAEADVVHLYNVDRRRELVAATRAARRMWPQAVLAITPILHRTSLSALRPGVGPSAKKLASALAKDAVAWGLVGRALRSADVVFPVSRGERRALRRWFFVPSSRCEIIPNGIRLERWPMRTAPVDRTTQTRRFGLAGDIAILVACVGRLEHRKNQLTLLRALDHLPRAGLILVGPDGDAAFGARVREDATRYPGRVAFAGALGQAEVADLLRSVDVHVLPSFRESMNFANLEAGASGCEVVAPRDSWTDEYLGDDAAYADAASPAAIAAAIEEVMARPRQPRLRATVERYPWSATAEVLAASYRRLCAARLSRAAR